MNTLSPIKRFARLGIYLNMFGVIFSGLFFPVLSMLCCPQPAWVDAELFANSFHPLQTATFFCGYFLVIGSLLTFIALYSLSPENKKLWAFAGLIINVVFTAIVFINYIIQTTYIPYLATNFPAGVEIILPVFTMANPGSFAWALEMYGWGGIGLSFIFMMAIFGTNKIDRTLKILFAANAICSVGGAIMTSIDMNWLFTTAGLVSLVVWNTLVFVIDLVLLKYLRK